MGKSIYGEMTEVNDLSALDVLLKLLDGADNLDLKTHIHKPKQFTSLEVLQKYLKDNQCNVCSKLVDLFITKYRRNMVSYKRLSRTETIKALSSFFDKEAIKMSFTEKLTSSSKTR